MREVWRVSVRKACRALRIDRSLYTYKSKRGDQAGLKLRIKEICETRLRFGYRRIHVLLRREGWQINEKRTRRLYNELGLQLRNKTPPRRVKAKLRQDRTEPTQTNQVWAMGSRSGRLRHFVHDQLATGRKLRILTTIDTFSRFSPATDPRFSYRGEDVVLDFSRPGKPTDNAYVESFNGSFRSECLNAHWFMSLDDARLKLEDWRRDYNEVRPHSAIGNKTPVTLMSCSSA